MPQASAALAADLHGAPAETALRGEALLIDLDDVAARRERLAAYAQATAAVIVYRFAIPAGASVSALGGGERDARAQLDLIVGLTGGPWPRPRTAWPRASPSSWRASSRPWLARWSRPISSPSTWAKQSRLELRRER